MSGRVDVQCNENISVMKCCCEKQIQELEEKDKRANKLILELEEKDKRANKLILELEEKDKSARERIEDLEEVGKLCMMGLTVLCDPVP